MAREAPNQHIKGTKKYKEWISKDTKRIDKHSNLPFTFIKPPKRSQARREIYFICAECEKVGLVNKNTVSSTCSGCRAYNRIEDVPNFSSEEELEIYLKDNQ